MRVTPEIVRELLHYDPDTGLLTWRHREIAWFKSRGMWAAWNKRYAGNTAGHIQRRRNGYVCLSLVILKKRYLAHRVAWLYMTDEPLPEEIDHINRDATDNRWANLRASDARSNRRNTSMRVDNTSGYNGVTWCKQHRKWSAQVSVLGKCKSLGLYDDVHEAGIAAARYRQENGFSAGHGESRAKYHA